MALPPVLVPALKSHEANGAINATAITRNFGITATITAIATNQNHHCFQIGLSIFGVSFPE